MMTRRCLLPSASCSLLFLKRRVMTLGSKNTIPKGREGISSSPQRTSFIGGFISREGRLLRIGDLSSNLQRAHGNRSFSSSSSSSPFSYYVEKRSSSSLASHRYLSFYKYGKVKDPQLLRDQLEMVWRPLGIRGRIYVAEEGINAQMTVPLSNYDYFRRTLLYSPASSSSPSSSMVEDLVISSIHENFPLLKDSKLNETLKPIENRDLGKVFKSLHVRLKKKIVADTLPSDCDLDLSKTERLALSPSDWHQTLLSSYILNPFPSSSSPSGRQEEAGEGKEKVLLLDVRNFYESQVGRFSGAVRLPIERFAESIDALEALFSKLKQEEPKNSGNERSPDPNLKVMMYCTGGIRCEKLGAYLTQKMGFSEEQVKTLSGGINAYQKFTELKSDASSLSPSEATSEHFQSLFQGVNSQFDGRLAEDRWSPSLDYSPPTSSSSPTSPSSSPSTPLSSCDHCGVPMETLQNCSNPLCDILISVCESCKGPHLGTCSDPCKEFMSLSPEERTKLIPLLDKLLSRLGNIRTVRSSAFYREFFSGKEPSSLSFSSSSQSRIKEGYSLISSELQSYVESHSSFQDTPQLTTIMNICKLKFPELSWHMKIGSHEGSFLSQLILLSNSKKILELGTFVGYSALKMVEALVETHGAEDSDIVVVTCESNDKHANIAQENLNSHSHGNKVLLKPGPALATLSELSQRKSSFDLIFIDADKRNSKTYFDFITNENSNILSPTGFIVVDNVLWRGMVTRCGVEGKRDKFAVEMDEFNKHITKDNKTLQTVLPLRDGITLIQFTPDERKRRQKRQETETNSD